MIENIFKVSVGNVEQTKNALSEWLKILIGLS